MSSELAVTKTILNIAGFHTVVPGLDTSSLIVIMVTRYLYKMKELIEMTTMFEFGDHRTNIGLFTAN